MPRSKVESKIVLIGFILGFIILLVGFIYSFSYPFRLKAALQTLHTLYLTPSEQILVEKLKRDHSFIVGLNAKGTEGMYSVYALWNGEYVHNISVTDTQNTIIAHVDRAFVTYIVDAHGNLQKLLVPWIVNDGKTWRYNTGMNLTFSSQQDILKDFEQRLKHANEQEKERGGFLVPGVFIRINVRDSSIIEDSGILGMNQYWKGREHLFQEFVKLGIYPSNSVLVGTVEVEPGIRVKLPWNCGGLCFH